MHPSIYAACGFFQTEAEAIAGDCKDCCSVDCPPFDEVRLDAIGLCVKSPLLTEAAYPELVQRFLEGALDFRVEMLAQSRQLLHEFAKLGALHDCQLNQPFDLCLGVHFVKEFFRLALRVR